MDELIIQRWLRRRIRSVRVSIFMLGSAMLAGSTLTYNITWFCLFVPLALIGLGFGLPTPGAGSTLFITATTLGYFFVRKRRPLPEPEVTRLLDSGELVFTIPPIREHWLRVRSRDQVTHLTLRSMLYELLFITPMLLESAASVFRHWKRLGRIDVNLCARALAVMHCDLERTSFATLEARLPGIDMETLLRQLWLLDEIQFLSHAPQGLIMTEQTRKDLAAAEDAALIAGVA